MKRKNSLILIVLFSLLFLLACTKDIGGPEQCFNSEVLPIFVSNCAMSGCHNSVDKAADYDFTSYEGIMQGIKPKHPLFSEIYKSIKGNNPSMPRQPYSKLSSKDVNTIKIWINMGAKNTNVCNTCDTTNFTYSGRIKNIIDAWCVGCHNSAGSGGNYNLSNYAGLVAVAHTDKLLGSIKHLPGYLPMPQNSSPMQSCDVDAIQKWVLAGCPNN